MWNPFKRRINGPEITFLPSGRQVRVLPGTTVLQAALDNNVALDHACDGNLACSTCHIYIIRGEEHLNPPSFDEDEMLESNQQLRENSRLACQVQVHHDLTVEVAPEEELYVDLKR